MADDCALLVNDCSPLDDEDAMEEAVEDGLFALADDKADDEDDATHIEAVDDDNDDDSVSSSITLVSFSRLSLNTPFRSFLIFHLLPQFFLSPHTCGGELISPPGEFTVFSLYGSTFLDLVEIL